MQIDLHPADVVTLPPELGSLPDLRAAVRGRACVGLGCPDAGMLAGLPPPPAERPAAPTVLHPADDATTCFCLEFFAVAGVAITGPQLQVTATLDKVEIVDLAPAGLESIVECALQVLIVVGLLSRLRVAVGTLLLDLLAQLPGVVLSGTAEVPNDPAIEDDRFKLLLNIEVQ